MGKRGWAVSLLSTGVWNFAIFDWGVLVDSGKRPEILIALQKNNDNFGVESND
jgi:hypothetical protein